MDRTGPDGVVHLTREAFLAMLPPEAQPFGGYVWESALRHGISPVLLAAVIQHESGWGKYLTPQGPAGTGDGGHAHGLAQIDDRTWQAWLDENDWWHPGVNIDKGAEILAAALAEFPDDPRAGIARYNASKGRILAAIDRGLDPASVTTHDNQGRSYVENVLRHVDTIQAGTA
jgi:hypothetical protein